MDELKVSESDVGSDSESEPDKGNDKGKQIIDADSNATVATAKIQKNEPEDPEEEERLFHSQMWVRAPHYNSLSIARAKRTSFR